jgi:branched-chain amino acid transport system permease protein
MPIQRNNSSQVTGSVHAQTSIATTRRAVAWHLGIGAFTLLVLVLPMVGSNFFVFQATQLMVYAIAIMGLNLLTGVSGQISLGHGAFYAVGAYTAAILMTHFGVSYAWTLLAAGVFAFAVGILFGLPALRLEGHYLALATFALAIATPQILRLSVLEGWTGGSQGISTTKPEAPFGLNLNADEWLYYFVLAVTAALFLLARNLIASRSGRAMKAIKDNPVAAQSMGVNLALYKTLAFGLSASFVGIAGALGAIIVQFVAPDGFSFQLSVAFFVGAVVGGIEWLPGAFIGAAFVLLVPNVAEGISEGLSGAVYGAILILLIFLMPAGSGGLLATARRYIKVNIH